MEAHDEERWDVGTGRGGGVALLADVGDHVATIKTRQDLAVVVQALRQNLLADPDAWENPRLERYLAALAVWLVDLDGYFVNRGEPVPEMPSWRLLGKILPAAKMYEKAPTFPVVWESLGRS